MSRQRLSEIQLEDRVRGLTDEQLQQLKIHFVVTSKWVCLGSCVNDQTSELHLHSPGIADLAKQCKLRQRWGNREKLFLATETSPNIKHVPLPCFSEWLPPPLYISAASTCAIASASLTHVWCLSGVCTLQARLRNLCLLPSTLSLMPKSCGLAGHTISSTCLILKW